MYKNLKIEMLRRDLSVKELSKKMFDDFNIQCSPSALYSKIRGDYEFTLEEASSIRDIIDENMSIKYLFEKEESKG